MVSLEVGTTVGVGTAAVFLSLASLPGPPPPPRPPQPSSDFGQICRALKPLEVYSTVDGRNPAPLGNHEKPLFVGIYRGIIIPWFLRWCEMDFATIHSKTEEFFPENRLAESPDLGSGS